MRRKVLFRRKKSTLAVSYALAALCVLGVFWRISHNRAEDYKRQIVSTYRHSFTELASKLGQLDNALHKCVYAGTPAMISAVCTDIYGAASAAEYALDELPQGSGLERTRDFITRVGDLAYALSKKTAAGEAPSEEEYESLKSLADTASILSRSVNNGELPPDSPGSTQRRAKHISELRPKMLEGAREVIREEAAMIAAELTGTAPDRLKYDGEHGGELPVHIFTASAGSETISVEISKAGGKLVTLLSSRTPSGDAISQKDAVSIAERFLQKKGYRDMTVTHHTAEDGTVLVSFAHTRDGVTFYPDLISVRVARDNGAIIGVQCRDFVMNHHTRELPKGEISEDKAREKLSPRLTVLSHATAVILAADRNEVFCHEFTCEAEDGRRVTAYINAVTGAEEALLIRPALLPPAGKGSF